jgi:hypothetical protein
MSEDAAEATAGEDVKVVRRKAVGWFDTKALRSIGKNAIVTALLGERTARREVLAALDQQPDPPITEVAPRRNGFHDHSQDGGDAFWIDYVADTGDGFNATHSVAWLVGRDYVFVDKAGVGVEQPLPPSLFQEAGPDALGGDVTALPAGRILVMGGDQAYPAGSQENYKDRLHGPYRAARPWGDMDAPADPAKGRRYLYAIPGNHDWYDGLSSFIRQFCQPGRWMGCWQTQQRRSYFSLKLPHGVWLWGIDTETEEDIDAPQLAYFKEQSKLMAADDRLILAVPAPSWLDNVGPEAKMTSPKDLSWDKLGKIMSFVDGVDASTSGRLQLLLSGDLHHYAHYMQRDGDPQEARRFIGCGLGGAYTLGSARTPAQLDFKHGPSARLQTAFPTAQESNGMRNGVFKLPMTHPDFGLVLALLVLFFGWVAAGWNMPAWLGGLAAFKPATVLATLGLFGACWAFARYGKPASGSGFAVFAAAAAHGAAQVGVMSLVLSLLWWLWVPWSWWLIPWVSALSLVYLVPGYILSGYLRLANRAAGFHEQEIFSAQSIEDFKGFLRIKITRDEIVVHPIGLRSISRDWKIATSLTRKERSAVGRAIEARSPAASKALDAAYAKVASKDTDVVHIPPGATHVYRPEPKLEPHMIEEPIHIVRRKQKPAPASPARSPRKPKKSRS